MTFLRLKLIKMINELISYKIQHSCTNIKYQLPFYSLPQTIYVRNAEKNDLEYIQNKKYKCRF